jgi:hypothetical protein
MFHEVWQRELQVAVLRYCDGYNLMENVLERYEI